jgi:hypothetical protein
VRASTNASDDDLLKALPFTLQGKAYNWFTATEDHIKDWKDFQRRFKERFVEEFDKEQVLKEINGRTQGKGEKIAEFIGNLRHLAKHLKKSLSERRMVKIALSNLRPDYRNELKDQRFENLDEIIRRCQKYEKRMDSNARYHEPKAASESLIPTGAFVEDEETKRQQKKTTRIGAVENVVREKDVKPRTNKDKESEMGAVTTTSAAVEEGKARIGMVSRGKPSLPRVENNAISVQQYPPRRNQPYQWNNRQTLAPSLTRPPGPSESEPRFMGACYSCGETGHRVSSCPTIQCFNCRGSGHISANCPNRQSEARVHCRLCGQQGLLAINCPNCKHLFNRQGNEQAGSRQARATSPQINLPNPMSRQN